MAESMPTREGDVTPGTDAWFERRRQLWNHDARKLLAELLRYEDDHPQDSICLAGAAIAAEHECQNERRREVLPAPPTTRVTEHESGPPCPSCDLPTRLMGGGERYVCDNQHYTRVTVSER